MAHEAELLTFLHEVADTRVKGLSERVHTQPKFKEINQAMLCFIESVTDENARAVLMQYEALKNDYIALLMPFIYESGAKDILTTYGLMLRCINSEYT